MLNYDFGPMLDVDAALFVLATTTATIVQVVKWSKE